MANVPGENNLSLTRSLALVSPCPLLCPGRGWGWVPSAKAKARPGWGDRGQPPPPDRSWSGHQAMSPGQGWNLHCLLLLTKAECSGGQNVSEGETAKIITRVLEETQGVAQPGLGVGGRLGGSDSRWQQQAPTSNRLQPAGCSLGGSGGPRDRRGCSQGRPGAWRGLWASWLFLQAIGYLEA